MAASAEWIIVLSQSITICSRPVIEESDNGRNDHMAKVLALCQTRKISEKNCHPNQTRWRRRASVRR